MTVGCSVTIEGSRTPITIAAFSWGLCGEHGEQVSYTEPIESFGRRKVPGGRRSDVGTRKGICREGLNNRTTITPEGICTRNLPFWNLGQGQAQELGDGQRWEAAIWLVREPRRNQKPKISASVSYRLITSKNWKAPGTHASPCPVANPCDTWYVLRNQVAQLINISGPWGG